MDFIHVVTILSRRKGLILLGVLAATVFTYGLTRFMSSKWQATVHFIVPKSSAYMSPMNNQKGTEPDAEAPPMDMDTTKALATIYAAQVKSRDVLEPVLQKLNSHKVI